MNASDILGHATEWTAITREEATRHADERTVMVVYVSQGTTLAAPFTSDSRFHHGNGPYDYPSLKYFLKVQESFQKPFRSMGGAIPPPPPQPTDLPSEPEPIQVLEEPTKRPAEIKISKLDCERFAPLVDTVLIHYEITGDLDQAKSVHLRIASQKKENKYLLDRQLDGAPQAKGIFMWDGAVTDADFQGCVNLVGSPYWVQLGLAAPGGSPVFTNKVVIKVELIQTELTIGDGFGLGEDDNLYKNVASIATLRDGIKKTPGKGIIHMPGNFFRGSNDLNTSASFTVYQSFLGKGIPIPLFVKLWLKDKNGGKKRSEKAVAGTRIVWDALPEDEAGLDANLSERGVKPSAVKFIKKVSLYKQDKTIPPGATSQWELGGMRADMRARGLKERQHWEDLDGGWNTAKPAKRIYAGFSVCSKIGTAMADSGMLFYNGRIAGDRHQITAYADLEAELDVEDSKIGNAVPAEQKTVPLTLQNWRDIHVAKSYRIGKRTAELNFDDANPEFNKAAISILPKPGMVSEEIGERYASEYRDVLIVMSGYSFVKDAALQDPSGHPAAFLSYFDYRQKMDTDAGFLTKVWRRIKNFFSPATDDGYLEKCEHYARGIYFEACKAFPAGPHGITVFKFEKSGEHNQSSKYAGMSVFLPGYTTQTRAVLFVFQPGQATETVIHELGHTFFMPHAPGLGGGTVALGEEPTLHDAVQVCLMSYNHAAKSFCGLCLLRMGGWDHSMIDSNANVLDVFAPV